MIKCLYGFFNVDLLQNETGDKERNGSPLLPVLDRFFPCPFRTPHAQLVPCRWTLETPSASIGRLPYNAVKVSTDRGCRRSSGLYSRDPYIHGWSARGP